MDFKNTCENVPGRSIAVCPASNNRDENSLRIQENEVPSVAKMTNPKFDGKIAEKSTKDQKLPLKIKPTNLSPISPSVDDCPSNLGTDQDTIQPIEISNNSLNSGRKEFKKAAKGEGLPLKRIKPTKEGIPPTKKEKSTKFGERPLKKKKNNPMPISQMVMEAIKALRKRNGASVEAIVEYMKNQHKVDAKLVKRYVTRFLLSAVQKGVVEQLKGAGDSEGFKISKTKKDAKVGPKLKVNQKNAKAERK